MQRRVAFLRAINVGRHTVKMDQLRRLFEQLSFDDVNTFIASGNVVFSTREKTGRVLEQRIEQHLKDSLGYDVATFVRSLDELAAVATCEPFTTTNSGGTLYVGFLHSVPSVSAQKQVRALKSAVDELHISGRELYWLAHRSFSESELSGALLEKTLGMPMTLRNRNTIERIVTKYG